MEDAVPAANHEAFLYAARTKGEAEARLDVGVVGIDTGIFVGQEYVGRRRYAGAGPAT